MYTGTTTSIEFEEFQEENRLDIGDQRPAHNRLLVTM